MTAREVAEPLSKILAELDAYKDDPVQFVRTKHRICDAYIASLSPDRQKYAKDFQESLDVLVAMSGSPNRALQALAQEMQERCEVLKNCQEQLQTGDVGIEPWKR